MKRDNDTIFFDNDEEFDEFKKNLIKQGGFKYEPEKDEENES